MVATQIFFIFTPKIGEDSHFDEHIFQMGWFNHQPGKNISPFCIASGMRMLKEDWSNCPACNFPARHSVFTAMLQANGCPMCDSMVKPDEVKIVNDPSGQITYYKSLFQASENESAPSAPAPPPPPPP